MYKRITEFVLLFFFLLTLFSAEAGWLVAQVSPDTSVSQNSTADDWDHEEDFPADAEEDSTEENREIDEYESHFVCYSTKSADPLLNLHYTQQHLLFKQHFRELIVPPPKA
jgi:hypothetical protein